jgi:predicted site-specific integrase-resolvase
MTKKPNWISEQDAADRMGYKPMVLRRYCQEGRLQITYTRVNRKKIEYNLNDIENHKMKNAVMAL